MSDHDVSEQVDEGEEEEDSVQDRISQDAISTSAEKRADHPTPQANNGDDINLEPSLSKDLQQSLKIAVTHEPNDIGPSPYKVAIVGMNELGSATAFLLICRQVVTDVILIDRHAQRLAGIRRDQILACHSPSIVR